MEKNSLTRRDFLRAAAMSAVGLAAASCVQPTPQVIEKEVPVEKIVKETVVVEKEIAVDKVIKETVLVEKEVAVEKVVTATPEISQYKESPMLAGLVAQDQLPAADERVPVEPLVLVPNDKIGKHGGDYHLLTPGFSGGYRVRHNEYELLFRWTPDWSAIVPNVVKGFAVEDEGKTFLFDLRKGMNWSDGHPFTADDFVWWYEEMSDEDLNPSFSVRWSTQGDPVVVTKVDDYTVKWTFTQPYGILLQRLCQPGAEVFSPKHHNQQYHPDYADADFLAKAIKDAGADLWYEGWSNWTIPSNNAERPVVYAWTYPRAYDGLTPFIAPRNAFYWKVDPEGNQLPYIDRVYWIFGEEDLLVLTGLAGQVDCQDRYITGMQRKPLWVESADKIGIVLYDIVPGHCGNMPVGLNLTHEDPVTREIFQNKDFRIALSHAMNREEINQVVYAGTTTATQPAPLPESRFYDAEMEQQYTEYDPDKANQILDEILPDKDADGFRMRPDGKTLEIVCTCRDRQEWLDNLEIISTHWQAVGIKMVVSATANALFNERLSANKTEIAVNYRIPGGMDVILSPRTYLPVAMHSMFAPLWSQWYLSGGKEGEEPIPAIKKQLELYDELLVTVDPNEQDALMKEILQIAKENFWTMGILRMPREYGVRKKNLANVPEWYWSSWAYPHPAPTNPEQFFWDI